MTDNLPAPMAVPPEAFDGLPPEDVYMGALATASLAAAADRYGSQLLADRPIYVQLREEFVRRHKVHAADVPRWPANEWDR